MKEILLTQGKVALVDDEDFERLNQFKWCAHHKRKAFYVVRTENCGKPTQKTVTMHRSVLDYNGDLDVDHINGDGLDNRKENLRVVTHRKNLQNRHHPKTSQYPGVRWQRGGWEADIKIKGKKRYLGRFSNEDEAATAYRVACAVLVGDSS